MAPTTRPKRTRGSGRATTAPDKSWAPGRTGQGGEGYSKGYGGSKGRGTGASGPDKPEERVRQKAPAPKKTKARR